MRCIVLDEVEEALEWDGGVQHGVEIQGLKFPLDGFRVGVLWVHVQGMNRVQSGRKEGAQVA